MAEERVDGTPWFARLTEILGLWVVVIVQPLFGLIGENAPFLLHHRPDAIDLATWVAVWVFAVPALLWLSEWLVGRWSPRAGRRLHSVVLGSLVGLFVLSLVRRAGDPLPNWLWVVVALGATWLGMSAVDRWPGLRQFFGLLALAAPIVVWLFWSSSGAEAARAVAGRTAAQPAEAVGRGAVSDGERDDLPAPVVWVVFDELPLLSILDAELEVDADLCPNLAALSREAIWYRNARTVWPMTNPSIASMLTGRVVDPSVPPTHEQYPRNLFTLAEPTHDVSPFELMTSMAPSTPQEVGDRPPRGRRLAALLSDSSIVAAHQLLPPTLGALPPIDNRWGDFGAARVVRGRGDAEADAGEKTPWTFALTDGRGRRFEQFLEAIESGDRPGLYFAHVMLPHLPYRYLPSGRVYGGRAVYGQASTAWNENEWFALDTYQRHLLQVGYVDHLIGLLIERLRETGLWDSAVVVITSDHGASHWPGQDRRVPQDTEHPEDIFQIPLFIKSPGQRSGGIDDRPVRTTDVLPTVAALVGWALDSSVTGASLVYDGSRSATDEMPEFVPDRESLARKLELFDPSDGTFRWVAFGAYAELVGREADELDVGMPKGSDHSCEAQLDQLPVLESWDPEGRFSPARWTGSIECERSLPVDAFVALALNGRIAATAKLQAGRDGLTSFAAMTPEALLRSGANDVGLFLLLDDGTGFRAESVRIRP